MILYICYHNPFGTKGGGAMASHAYLRAFTEICDGNLDLVCSSELKDVVSNDIKCRNIYFAPDRTKYKKIASVFTGHMNRYVQMTRRLLYINNYDTVVFDQSNISGPLVKLANKLGLRTITIHHNYEKEYFSDNNKGLYKILFLRHVVKWEKIAYRNSTLNLFLTMQDLKTFSKVYGNNIGGKCAVIGAFEYGDYVEPRFYPRPNNQLTFAITGSLGNTQTTDAISYFFTELYLYMPVGCKIIVAGRNPSDKVVELCGEYKNVELIPNPNDMNEIVSQADIYICATRIGGGLKLRVMDGLKNGLPVITHSCSARGFDAFYNQPIFKVFNTPLEFKSHLLELVSLFRDGAIKKESVIAIYKDNFSYTAGVNRLKEIMKSL